MRIYLAGDIRDNFWREVVKNRAPSHFYLDPTDHEHEHDERGYTYLDKEQIRMADAVFAYLDPNNPSLYGTSHEIGYADGLGIPVFLIDELDGDPRQKWFGMARATSAVVFSTLARGTDFLNSLPR